MNYKASIVLVIAIFLSIIACEKENIEGTMVGFRFPEEVGGANVQGYHFHFLTADKQHGGHLLDCQTEEINVFIDHASSLNILPE